MGKEEEKSTHLVEVEVPPAFFESTGFLLAMAGAESRRRWVEWLAAWDLRPSHYSTLMVIGARGALSQQELAGMIAVDPRNLVSVIDHLERKKLVARQAQRGDRRRNSVDLTRAGESLLGRLAKSGQALEEDLLDRLDGRERKELQKLLLKIVRG